MPLINTGDSYAEALARLRREVKRAVDRGEREGSGRDLRSPRRGCS
jgi:hypothetical protein